MLARVLASSLCLLGAASAGLGVASATVWRPSDTLTASTSATGFLVTDPGVLDLAGDSVTVTAHATGPVVIALGTTGDVDAWVGDSRATHVTGLSSRTELATSVGTGTPSTSTSSPATTSAPSTPATQSPTTPTTQSPTTPATQSPTTPATQSPTTPATQSPTTPATPDGSASPSPRASDATDAPATTDDPTGSDLWVEQVTGDGSAKLTWQRTDGRWSILVAAPAGGRVDLTMSWPQTVTTPWLRPGLTAGVVLVILGAAWWALILVRARRATVGPRRARTPSRRRAVPEVGVPAAGPGEPVIQVTSTAGRHSSHAASAPPDAPVAVPTGRRHGRRAAPVTVPVAGTVEVPVLRPAELPFSPAPPTTGSLDDAPVPDVPTPDVRAPGEPTPDVAAPGSPVPVAAGVPLTRRALREMREREAREREAGAATAGHGPAEPGSAEPGPAAPEPAAPSGPAPRGVIPEAPPSRPVAAPAPGDSAPAEPSWPVVPTPTPPTGRGTRRGPWSRLRRRPAEPQPQAVAPEPIEPVTAPEPPPVSGPSADAWRRAWGLPGATSPGAAPDEQEEER